MKLVLIGFKNSGKTSVGRILSEQLHIPFLDTDDLIESYYHKQHACFKSVREIYQFEGAQYFRTLERDIIQSACMENESVISTGGGSLLNTENCLALKRFGQLVYLDASPESLYNRLSSESLPAYIDALEPKKSFIQHYESRKKIYQAYADLTIDTHHKTIKEITDEILLRLRRS